MHDLHLRTAGVELSLDVHSLRAAMHAALSAYGRGPLGFDGWRWPSTEVGNEIASETFRELLGWISRVGEGTAAEACQVHAGLAANGLAEPLPDAAVIDGLVDFLRDARVWLDEAEPTVTVQQGKGTIRDRSLDALRWEPGIYRL